MLSSSKPTKQLRRVEVKVEVKVKVEAKAGCPLIVESLARVSC
jgi:hypothetical protein